MTSTSTSGPHARKRRLIGFSTKMYFTPQKTQSYLSTLTSGPALPANTDVFVLADTLSLPLLPHSPAVALGAQDCHWTECGAFTGCISPAVLASLGCRFVALGHAERRRYFGDTDETVALKAQAVARNGMVPVVCIGEEVRKEGGGEGEGQGEGEGEGGGGGSAVESGVEGVRPQVESVLSAVRSDAEVVLAYEPVWAIGAAEPASPEHVVGVVRGIREMSCVKEHEGGLRILYGGSVKEGLWGRLRDEEDRVGGSSSGGGGGGGAGAGAGGAGGGGGVDGLFCGRFAHDVEAFRNIVEEVAAE